MLVWEDPTAVPAGHRLAAGEHRRARDRSRGGHTDAHVRGPANANRGVLAHSHPASRDRDRVRREDTLADSDRAAAHLNTNTNADIDVDIDRHANAHADPDADARAVRHANPRAGS